MFTTKEKQCAVICFLAAEGVEVCEMQLQMKTKYGEHSMALACVQVWHKRFRERQESLKDHPRPDQSHLVIMDA